MEETNSGIGRLAGVIRDMASEHTQMPLVLDFGTIKKNGTLQTNTFPNIIDKEDYTVLWHCIRCKNTCAYCDGNCKCKHGIVEGKETRVLVAWIESEPVVVGVLVE